jgi:thioredoxin-like negative regulator of GroEL
VAKPIVDGLEKKLVDKAEVIRLNVMDEVGRHAAAQYGVRGLPTLIVVAAAGRPVYSQVGIVRPAPVIEQVEAVLAAP